MILPTADEPAANVEAERARLAPPQADEWLRQMPQTNYSAIIDEMKRAARATAHD
jgi:hypothetical protein